MNELELTGRARTHIEQLENPRVALHRDVVEPFLALRAAAAREGMEIAPFSAFRDFSTQVEIWNQKFRGERPLYDRDGSLRPHAALDSRELVEAILLWSAVPGASRHHWGTEVDVYDKAALPEGSRVHLLPSEYAPSGVFGRLSGWLDENLQRFGFYRPYDRDRGGVAPEPWHLSYAPVSTAAQQQLSVEIIADALRGSELLCKHLVLERLPDFYVRFVANVSEPPAGLAA
ncbi:MAG TPA: M15 family metallopeptidase [Burkholderiales bacterium]|nr:M15 family metallopeptidase [Burkholderiales bacterium]